MAVKESSASCLVPRKAKEVVTSMFKGHEGQASQIERTASFVVATGISRACICTHSSQIFDTLKA